MAPKLVRCIECEGKSCDFSKYSKRKGSGCVQDKNPSKKKED